MLLYGYILRIARVLSQLENLNEENIDLLCLFVVKSRMSIYQVYKIFEKEGKKIAYKNVHKKVQRLIDLKLIERVTDTSNFEERDLARGAKYYKISEEGIFAIFDNPSLTFSNLDAIVEAHKQQKSKNIFKLDMIDYKHEIYKYHKDCNFYRLFLFPWITIETIENLDPVIIDIINNYLYDCCKFVKDTLHTYLEGLYLMPEGLVYTYEKQESIFKNSLNFNSLKDGINKVDDSNDVFYFMRQVFAIMEPQQSVLVNRQKNNNNHIEISKIDGWKTVYHFIQWRTKRIRNHLIYRL